MALADGYRESTESCLIWLADLLRDAARRGMRAPVLAVGDGALGFWGALRGTFPEAREQRCWFHKVGNVLTALAKSAQPAAKKALAEDLGRRGQGPRPRRRAPLRRHLRGEVPQGGRGGCPESRGTSVAAR